MFGTTWTFLDYFGLTSLEQLPTLAEIKDFEQVNPVLELAIGDAAVGTAQTALFADADADPDPYGLSLRLTNVAMSP